MKYLYKRFLLLVAASGLLLCFSGCGPDDTDHDGVTDDVDQCLTVSGPGTNHGCPVIIPQINKIHLYLDNSASMAGYYRDQTDYKTIIADLAVKMDKEIKPVDISFIAQKTFPYTKNITDFTTDLARTPMAAQKSSELHRMIAEIADHCGDKDVCLLISDCILSFSDKDIKADPEINRDNASSTLKNNIYTTFTDLKKKGYAASIYGFRSKFFGIYYDYQNQKTKLPGYVRPFYIWAIAKRNILLDFNSRLEHISSFKPEKALHFGLVSEPVKTYQILPEIERKGDWLKSTSGISDVDLAKGQTLQLCLALNLATLPSYVQNIQYLQNNLMINTTGCTAKFQFKERSLLDRSKLHSESQIQAFENASHYLLVTVTEMSLSTAQIHFSLPLKYDTWYLNWSTMNDKQIKKRSDQTFALEYLIAGAQEAYDTSNKHFIDLSLLLTK